MIIKPNTKPMTTMKNNQNDLPIPPQNPHGCSGHNKHQQNPPPDDEADFGPVHTYVVVTRAGYCLMVFFVFLAVLEGATLFWIFRHLWHAVPPGAR